MLKDLPAPFKKILKYPEIIGISALLIILIIGVWVGAINVPRSGPIQGGGSPPVLIWKLTERDTTGDLLTNSLTDNTREPDYHSSGAYQLNRNIDGSLNLYRIQGELEYRD